MAEVIQISDVPRRTTHILRSPKQGIVLPINEEVWRHQQAVALAENRYFGYEKFQDEVNDSLRGAWELKKRFSAKIPKVEVHSTTDFFRKVRNGWYGSIQEVVESLGGRWAAHLHPDLEELVDPFLRMIITNDFKARMKTRFDISAGTIVLNALIPVLETQSNVDEVTYQRMHRPIWEDHAIQYVERLRTHPVD